MTDSSSLTLTALLLSLAVVAQAASRYAKAYFDAPSEVTAFLDAVDSSIAENESYDRDIAKVQRLEDKLRLGRLLRDIQRGGDALREELNALVVCQDDTRLHSSARIWWADHRTSLEEKVRRLDLLRMRFLVVHMGVIAGAAAETTAAKRDFGPRDVERPAAPSLPQTPRPNALAKALADGIKSKPPLRRLSVQPSTPKESPEENPRMGWAGVIQELQKSPLLRERHASIEMAMSRPSP
ncbi:hypothetical protein C8A05DRAFT_44463 [Staphylotrichum tortipilum]|uniref:Fungal N-terminal domain-containing protein n=1 Tax=Staphylotrichum tortipilum TaxID=2831512 RepID=A0AAN6MK66_9PEZI|nr:hypothetical protein C8A05DRAFT_44463 [Staphylotrichum longicolle]